VEVQRRLPHAPFRDEPRRWDQRQSIHAVVQRLLMDLFHPLPCVDCIDSSQNLGLPSAALSIASSRTSLISTAISNESSLADLDLLVAEDDFA
jgi:hypothetical protein